MKNLALPRIQKMKAYNPPLAGRRSFSGKLLDFNERTLPIPPKIKKSLQDFLKEDKLQVYPEYGQLEAKIAKYAGVNQDQIIITNGSDQAIDIIFRAFTDSKDSVIIPAPSFPIFFQSAQIVGNKILQPLYDKETLSFPFKEMTSLISKSVKLIVVCTPNNPTGTTVSVEDIEKIAKQAPSAIVLVDEAYFDFSTVTAVPLIKKYSNIIITRTFSKAFGLPSLRIGYIIASPKYINELFKIRGPYDVNMMAYVAASAAIDNLKKAQEYAREIMEQAKPMVEDFFTKNNITFYKSSGNFLLYRPVRKQEEKILKENGILVRLQEKINIQGALRLTIGTVDQMRQFIKIYQDKILNNSELKKYAFIDRDGTLIFEPQDTFQIDSLEKLKILDGAIQGLKKLKDKGFKLILISNQDGLGTKLFPKKDFEKPQNKMLKVFKEEGIIFDKIFVCPHLPSDQCNCRKPKTGLVKNFLNKTRIDKSNSFVCGDRNSDKEFAKNLNIKFVPMKINGNFYEALENEEVVL